MHSCCSFIFNRILTFSYILTLSAILTQKIFSLENSNDTEIGAICIDESLCGTSSLFDPSLSRLSESIPEIACPKFIIEQQTLRDSKSSLTADSPDEICSTGVANSTNYFQNASELEAYLRQNSYFSDLNQTSPPFSTCLSQGVSIPIGLGKTSLSYTTKTLPENKKKLAIMEHYLSLKRLSDGIERSIQSITAIDSMIGASPLLKDISCNALDAISSDVKNQCSSFKKCSNQNSSQNLLSQNHSSNTSSANPNESTKHIGDISSYSSSSNSSLKKSAQDTLLALQGIEAIERERLRLVAERGKLGGSINQNRYQRRSNPSKQKIEELTEQIRDLEDRKKNLQNLYPWILGKVFQDSYNRSDYSNYAKRSEEEKEAMETQMAGLITNQLTHTREKLKERTTDFIKAFSCIKEDNTLCNELDMDKILAHTPSINHEEVFERDRKKKLKEKLKTNTLTPQERAEYRKLSTFVTEADILSNNVTCLQTQRRKVGEINQELALGALDVGLVIGTMGLGSSVVAGRIALRIGGTLSKAQKLSKAKKLQGLGIFGTDVSLSSPYMKEAINVCEDTINQLEEMQNTEQTANKEQTANQMCEQLPIRVKHTSDIKACILQASLASLPITLPILGLSGMAIARKLRGGSQADFIAPSSSINKAEEVLGTRLSPSQKEALEKAHLVGQEERGKNGAIASIGNYTEDQLRQKAEILRQAGFSSSQRRKLIEEGIVGDDFLRRANAKLEERLQNIRSSSEESWLEEQGFKRSYYVGVDQAREANEVAKHLRAINADPEKTHIPYFSDQIDKTISDFEQAFRKHNQDNPKFLEERLAILEEIKKEAQQRIKDQNVTYDWWANFNLRLPMIATKDSEYVYNLTIDTLKTHEGLQKHFMDSPDARLYLGPFLFRKEAFPDLIMTFSTDDLGIMAFNRLEENSHFVGVSGKPMITDGSRQNPMSFFEHDLDHWSVFRIRYSERDLPPNIIKRVSSISNPSDRAKAELALFLYSHERGFNNFSEKLRKYYAGENRYMRYIFQSQLQSGTRMSALRMMTDDHAIQRFSDPDDLQGMLPDHVNVNNKEEVRQFLEETADVFADVLLASS